MGTIEELVEANHRYAESFSLGHLPMPPSRKVAVLACMDARLNVPKILGLETGDAHIIRNAGGEASDDALRSLIISSRLLGTRSFLVLNHTDCGMLTFRDEDLRRQLKEATGQDAAHLQFHAFSELGEHVRAQVRRIRENPFLPEDIEVRGFVYDVKTGRLREVPAAAGQVA
jgi:carbonic anhydrase